MMDFNIHVVGQIKVVELGGELNSLTSNDFYMNVTQHVQMGDSVILDMQNVTFMSSAGIRALLLLYRQIHEEGGQVVLAGLPEELSDTLEITGFLEFFNTSSTIDAGMQTLRH